MKDKKFGVICVALVTTLLLSIVYIDHRSGVAYEHMRHSLTKSGKIELICMQAVTSKYLGSYDYFIDRNLRVIENSDISYLDKIYNSNAFESIAKECL